jgi:Tfp pilus assembly protein PilV
MAVAAVALMGLLAMATMGMRYGRLAVDDTMTGTIAQDLFAEWRVKDFPLPADIRWYNRDGGPSGLADALYQCQIRVYDSAPTGFVKTVELVFVWPKVNDFAASPRTNRYFTNVSRLDYPN